MNNELRVASRESRVLKLFSSVIVGFSFMLILMFFVSTDLFGQRFEGGLLAGFNASQVDGDHISGYHKPGVLLGGYVQTDISNRVYLGAELKYSQKGSRKNPDPESQDQEKYIMRLGYFEVPAYIGLRTGETVSIFTGASVGYMAHGTEYDNYGELEDIEKRPFNTFDFQAFIGVRFELTKRITLDVRGAYSFLPIRDLPGEAVSYWLDDEYNNVLSTSLYYRFDR